MLGKTREWKARKNVRHGDSMNTQVSDMWLSNLESTARRSWLTFTEKNNQNHRSYVWTEALSVINSKCEHNLKP